jgi:hypothetical protein
VLRCVLLPVEAAKQQLLHDFTSSSFANSLAVLSLDAQVLSSILSAYGSKLLGEKQANEASMTIRDTLCAAAAAHNYHRPQVRPSAVGEPHCGSNSRRCAVSLTSSSLHRPALDTMRLMDSLFKGALAPNQTVSTVCVWVS